MPKTFSLSRAVGSASAVKAMKARLSERGAEILAITNPYEVMRWRSRRGVGVVYRNQAGRLSAAPEAQADLESASFSTGGSLSPVIMVSRKTKGRAGEVEALLERDGRDCFYCGLVLPNAVECAHHDDEVTIEHLVSLTHGGPNHIANKFLAHGGCNRIAGHLSAPEKILLRDRMRSTPPA